MSGQVGNQRILFLQRLHVPIPTDASENNDEEPVLRSNQARALMGMGKPNSVTVTEAYERLLSAEEPGVLLVMGALPIRC